LKDVEPIALEKVKGPKGDVANALTAAIEEHLHEEPYSQAELEALFGETLDQFFGGNASQLRAVHVASTLLGKCRFGVCSQGQLEEKGTGPILCFASYSHTRSKSQQAIDFTEQGRPPW
jgi:hypothetical protein